MKERKPRDVLAALHAAPLELGQNYLMRWAIDMPLLPELFATQSKLRGQCLKQPLPKAYA